MSFNSCILNTLSILLLTYLLQTASTEGNISNVKYELDSSPSDLVWCGIHNEYVLILTDTNSVYKSEDKGMHWKKLNDIFINTGKDELEPGDKEIGRVSRIIKSPADKSLLIFLGTQGINWISTDCGNNIKALNHGRRIKEFYFHPTERNWGLASAFSLCEDFVGEPCKIYKELYLTKDLGENWVELGKYVVEFDWGVKSQKQIDKGVPKERIIMTYEPRGRGNQKSDGWNYKIDCVYSDDFFKTTKVLVSKGNKFLLTEHYLFVAQVLDQQTQEVMLVGSKSTHKDYNMQPIETNQKSFTEHSYIFLDTTLHSVFLHMNHFGPNSQYGHIYTSGPQGLHYSLSLKNNVKSTTNQCDFEKVESVEGVYIANVISGKYMKLAKAEMDSKASDNSMGKIVAPSRDMGGKKVPLNYKNYIKTMITFNRGGDWKKLKAPERDSLGNVYKCGNYCFLHLFGISSDYPPFYSVSSAAGIIIGNGNVGRYLSKDNISTFMSRDGGLTWYEVRKGSHIYEIGDHGGLILMADDENPSDTILYSWDEGLTWNEYRISDEKFMIKNIIIEPDSISHNFIIYGDTSKNGITRGISIGLDFGEVYPPCKGSNNPDTESSDYEKWSPSDGRSGKQCLLGHKIVITRRKQKAKCVNQESFERTVEIENCECTDDDYMCDLGYHRNEPGDPCTSINPNYVSIVGPPAYCDRTYKVTKGYRRIPGDTCKGGVQYDPIVLPCPNNQVSRFSILVLLFVIVAFAAVIYFLFNNGFSINQNIMDTIKGVLGKIVDLIPVNTKTYETVNFDDEDNMLFEEEHKVLNPIQNVK